MTWQTYYSGLGSRVSGGRTYQLLLRTTSLGSLPLGEHRERTLGVHRERTLGVQCRERTQRWTDNTVGQSAVGRGVDDEQDDEPAMNDAHAHVLFPTV